MWYGIALCVLKGHMGVPLHPGGRFVYDTLALDVKSCVIYMEKNIIIHWKVIKTC